MFEIANLSWASVVINARAFSVREEATAQQWDSNRLVWYDYVFFYVL